MFEGSFLLSLPPPYSLDFVIATMLEMGVEVGVGHYWYFVVGQRMLNILQFVLGVMVPPSEEHIYEGIVLHIYSVYSIFNTIVLINLIYMF